MTDFPNRELYASLVYLADNLVADFDVVDLLNRLVSSSLSLLNVSAAGILLDDQRGSLRVLASSSEETHMLELLELQGSGGPCRDALTTSSVIEVPNLDAARDRWPEFVAAAEVLGIQAAYAVPLRLRETTIGALNLLCDDQTVLGPEDLEIARLLTNIATIGIINHRLTSQQTLLAEQLQSALNTRIVIEQAKGVIAERTGVDMAVAFEMLRTAARSSRRPLTEVAAEIARGGTSAAI